MYSIYASLRTVVHFTWMYRLWNSMTIDSDHCRECPGLVHAKFCCRKNPKTWDRKLPRNLKNWLYEL